MGIFIYSSHYNQFGGKMAYTIVDEKARICLTKEIVDRYGKRFVIVPAKGEIILIPVSDDPLKSLQEEGKKIPKNLAVQEIRKKARKDLENEVFKKSE